MSADLTMACRMAKACDVTYYIGSAGGPTSCPTYHDVGFTALPETFAAGGINAALVGTTATEIVVAFRGTLPINTEDWNEFILSIRDWVNDGAALLATVPYTNGMVHRGFGGALDLLWNNVSAAVLAQQAGGALRVVVTGHSKGGALASLAAMRMQHDMATTPAAVYTYGSPRPGNTQFARDYSARILHSWRFENTDDLVPHLPPIVLLLDFLAKADSRLSGLSAHDYHHVGVLEFINWTGRIMEGSSLTLDAQRLAHLAELAPTGQLQQMSLDHSLERQYIPKLQGAV